MASIVRAQPQLTAAIMRCSLRPLRIRSNGARASRAAPCAVPPRGGIMFGISDLFQWERFITPSIIKVFYWLAVVISLVAALSGIFSGLALLTTQPIGGAITIA